VGWKIYRFCGWAGIIISACLIFKLADSLLAVVGILIAIFSGYAIGFTSAKQEYQEK